VTAAALPLSAVRSFTGSSDQTARELTVLHVGRLVEFAIYLGSAALALAFAWFGVRRRRYL
jgi:hypothetical protein